MALTNATVDNRSSYSEGMLFVERVTLSGLTADYLANIPHYGPPGVAPKSVTFELTTPSDSGSPAYLEWNGSDTTNNEVDIRFSTEMGGNLTGMKGDLVMKWLEVAPQNRDSIATDNDGAS